MVRSEPWTARHASGSTTRTRSSAWASPLRCAIPASWSSGRAPDSCRHRRWTNVDVLVFDLGDEHSLGWTLPRRQRRSTRLVGLVPGGDIEAVERSQCTVLVRSELTPEGFRDCLASVVAGASAPVGSAGRPGSAGDSSPVGSVRAALAGAGGRLRRVTKRKGALFVVVVAALAAGAYGPPNRAEGLSGATVDGDAAHRNDSGAVAGRRRRRRRGVDQSGRPRRLAGDRHRHSAAVSSPMT